LSDLSSCWAIRAETCAIEVFVFDRRSDFVEIPP
jgi:hypothetical protein